MTDNRYSVMVLPRRADESVLLQSFIGDSGAITEVDGFGIFYSPDESSKQAAQKVLAENFAMQATLIEAAQLQYFINKPSGLVDLKVTIYFANFEDNLILRENMQWFILNDIPYAQMHPATSKWLPIILKSSKLLKATIRVEQPGDHTTGKLIEFTAN